MFVGRGKDKRGLKQKIKEHFTPWRIILDVSDIILATALAFAMFEIISKEVFIVIFVIYAVILVLYLLIRFKKKVEKELGLNGRDDNRKQ